MDPASGFRSWWDAEQRLWQSRSRISLSCDRDLAFCNVKWITRAFVIVRRTRRTSAFLRSVEGGWMGTRWMQRMSSVFIQMCTAWEIVADCLPFDERAIYKEVKNRKKWVLHGDPHNSLSGLLEMIQLRILRHSMIQATTECRLLTSSCGQSAGPAAKRFSDSGNQMKSASECRTYRRSLLTSRERVLNSFGDTFRIPEFEGPLPGKESRMVGCRGKYRRTSCAGFHSDHVENRAFASAWRRGSYRTTPIAWKSCQAQCIP